MMTNRYIKYTSEALEDLFNLNAYIERDCKSPYTARIYMTELEELIQMLGYCADSFPVVPELTEMYHKPVKRVNYKNMAVIFSIEEYVVIERIIPQSMVIY